MFLLFLLTWLLSTVVCTLGSTLEFLKAITTALSITHLIDNLPRLFRQTGYSPPSRSFPCAIRQVDRSLVLNNSLPHHSHRAPAMENRDVHEVPEFTSRYGADRTRFQGPGQRDMALVDNKMQPDVIILDGDSPVQTQHHDGDISCKNHILLMFPDICPDYLKEVSCTHYYQVDVVSSAILDKLETEGTYPTRPPAHPPSRKRKRLGGSNEPGDDLYFDSDEESEDRDPESVRAIKIQMATREHADNMALPKYGALAKVLITQDFPRVPQQTIRELLAAHNMSVFETYTAMDDKRRNWDEENMPWKEKTRNSKLRQDLRPDRMPSLDMNTYTPEERAALTEFLAARELRSVKDAKVGTKYFDSLAEKKNLAQAQKDGQTIECGICFEECALNRMVRCEGETTHWFCRSCLRTQAETQIGMGRYDLVCMSMDGCSSEFSREQKALFLDKKLSIALDRIEQETVLRVAGIANLESCPFCPYAAEYPPVEVDKEFRCENPRCRKVSCRLCQKETHIPKTCAEASADRGLDARHIVEEAMSEALIRRCNKCKNPFVKSDGCNKIKCTKCGTLQCDVCRKTIKDYAHFNDTRRGGRTGHCPLFDESENRYIEEVSKVEAETRQRVVNEDPQVDEAALDIPISKSVKPSIHKARQRPPIPPPVVARGPMGGLGRRMDVFDALRWRLPQPENRYDAPLPPPAMDNGLLKRAEGLVQASKQLVLPKKPDVPLQNEGVGLLGGNIHPGYIGNFINKVENLQIKKGVDPGPRIPAPQRLSHLASIGVTPDMPQGMPRLAPFFQHIRPPPHLRHSPFPRRIAHPLNAVNQPENNLEGVLAAQRRPSVLEKNTRDAGDALDRSKTPRF